MHLAPHGLPLLAQVDSSVKGQQQLWDNSWGQKGSWRVHGASICPQHPATTVQVPSFVPFPPRSPGAGGKHVSIPSMDVPGCWTQLQGPRAGLSATGAAGLCAGGAGSAGRSRPPPRALQPLAIPQLPLAAASPRCPDPAAGRRACLPLPLRQRARKCHADESKCYLSQ